MSSKQVAPRSLAERLLIKHGAIVPYGIGLRYVLPDVEIRFWAGDVLRTNLAQRLLPGARPWYGDGSV